jgi:protein involved in polysaccharide export with SLBB domain
VRFFRAGAVALVCASLAAGRAAVAAQQSRTGGTAVVRPASTAEAPQERRTVTPETGDATREELTRLLEETLKRASDASLKAPDRTGAEAEVARIRHRLEAGDFQAGDRLVVTFVSDSVHRDGMIVRDGPSLDFGALPQLSLAGILRSEVQQAIQQHLGKFFRAPEVRVELLMRLAVAGAVAKPGSYAVPADFLVSDVIMQAGGPTPAANPDKVVVMRAGRPVVDEKAYQKAVKEGYTVTRLGLQPGDEIRVGDRGGRKNWGQTVTIVVLSVSILTSLLALIRSSYAN